MNSRMMNDVCGRCGAIEECYEFMVAYAAQGLPPAAHGTIYSEIRESLQRAAHALAGLADSCRAAVDECGLESAARYHAFLAVLDRDARDSLAAFNLVLGQPTIGSQLIDNLNASIHLRALLTDLFLIDEIFRGASMATGPALAG
jgi:hypothetical protein